MLLSVVISAYNVEKYIDKCIESLSNQTRTDFEIVLIDDGSTDNTVKKCREWSKKDSRVVLYSNPHLGVGKSKNFGIAHANGEYITIIDADDWVEPNYVDELLSLAIECAADIVIADMYYATFDNGILKKTLSKVRLPDGNISKESTLYLLSKSRTFLCGKLIRKSLIEDNKAWLPEHSFEDIAVCPFLIAKANVLCHTSNTHYYYLRNRNTSIINDYNRLKYIQIALEELINLFINAGIFQLYEDELAYLYWGQVCHVWHITDDKFHVEAGKNDICNEILNGYKKRFPAKDISGIKYFVTDDVLEKIAFNLCLTSAQLVDDIESMDVSLKWDGDEGENGRGAIYIENSKVLDENFIWNHTDIVFQRLVSES